MADIRANAIRLIFGKVSHASTLLAHCSLAGSGSSGWWHATYCSDAIGRSSGISLAQR
jgi:hypothetical protein